MIRGIKLFRFPFAISCVAEVLHREDGLQVATYQPMGNGPTLD